mmetsp:Transcript_18332/g.58295  ORF Transcript_18332/g.58295 Transcript_18332/m.58295 type:complete len:102 (-) Transcript_18332:116-421(-)
MACLCNMANETAPIYTMRPSGSSSTAPATRAAPRLCRLLLLAFALCLAGLFVWATTEDCEVQVQRGLHGGSGLASTEAFQVIVIFSIAGLVGRIANSGLIC